MIEFANAQTYKLEYDLKQGQQVITDFHTEVNMKQTVMGIDQIVEMKMETGYFLEVNKKYDDQSYELLTEYRKLYVNISSAFFNLEVDTNNPKKEELINNIVQRLLRKPVRVILAKNGEIKNIQGFDNNINMVLDEINADDDQRDLIRIQLERNMGEENIRQNFSHYFGIYPEKPVRKGESWDINYQMILTGMEFEFLGKGALIEVTPRNYLIRIEGDVSTINSDDPVWNPQQIMLEGKQVSEITIDRKTGWPVKSITNQDISGLMLMQSSEPDDQPVEIPMVMKLRMNVNSR